jgi:hypothetical protein
LLADFFDWSGIHAVGCQNAKTALQVQNILADYVHRPTVSVEPNWYY